MTLVNRFLTLAFFSMFFSVLCFSQTQKKDLLIGKWAFDKFEFSGELEDVDPREIKEANKANNRLVMTFTADNKFKSEQKGGMEINNSSGTYKLLNSEKMIIMGEQVTILQLDKTTLKLYNSSDRPIIIFKRLQQ